MRFMMSLITVTAVFLSGWASPPPLAQAANLDTIADRVHGQPDFAHNAANNGGVSANSLSLLHDVALDAPGNLYVADNLNNRVLEYDAPLTTGQSADRVFGQGGSFTTTLPNKGGVSANSLWEPYGVALDEQGNLYVADTFNNRVLEYDAPLTTDLTADHVIGQPDFTHNTLNNGGVSANSLDNPEGVVLDVQGNLYIADHGNHRVLEYDTPLSAGPTADHVFGQGGSFSTALPNNGGVSANSLRLPFGVALDTQGNLYVADSGNNRVLEHDAPLTTDSAADRVFGQGGSFTTTLPNNGGVSASSLSGPLGVALDAQGNLYVADTFNNRLLAYDFPLTTNSTADHVFGQPDFTHNTANNGGVSDHSLNGPAGVAVDAQGNLHVADYINSRVLEFDVPLPYGAPALAALSPSTVAAGSPAFTLTVNGAGFVAGSSVRWNGSNRPTTYLNRTQLNVSIAATDVSAGGPFALTVFTPAPGGGTSSLLNLTLYARVGHDTTADTVQGQPNFTANAANNPLMPGGANRLNNHGGVAVDAHSGRLFVADTGNNRVLSWPNAAALANGQPADRVWGQPNFTSISPNSNGLSATSLAGPTGVALDAQGNLYVADQGNNRVLEYSAPLSSGMTASHVFGQGGSFTTALPNNGGVSANSLDLPYDVALDAQGNLYVADYANHRVLEYDTPLTTDDTADRAFGQPDFTHNTVNNGGVSDHSLNGPDGLALDAAGNLYVADYFNHRALEYDTALSAGATADRVFGQPDFSSGTINNGGVSASSLFGPEGVALDAQGNLYVADYGNNRILVYAQPLTADHTADRVFGQPDFSSGSINNGGVSAHSLNGPTGVALDAQRNLYVADGINHRVLEYDWALVKIRLPLVRR